MSEMSSATGFREPQVDDPEQPTGPGRVASRGDAAYRSGSAVPHDAGVRLEDQLSWHRAVSSGSIPQPPDRHDPFPCVPAGECSHRGRTRIAGSQWMFLADAIVGFRTNGTDTP
jgi:hypothetical protein